MKVSHYLLSIFILYGTHSVLAAKTNTSSNTKEHPTNTAGGSFSHLSVMALGSYNDFNFNSTAGTNYNLFKGYSKLVAVGGNNIVLSPTWSGGVSLFKAETHIGSQLFLSPGVASTSSQSIRNNTLYGHVMKQLKPSFYLDLAAAFGRNKVNTTSYIGPGTVGQEIGFATTKNTNWFASVTGLYTTQWKKLVITANGRLLYSEVDNGRYPFIFYSTVPNQTVDPLTNRSLFLMENVEVGYNSEKILNWTPFVNAGLVQVLSYQNSRSIVNSPINGLSPQLSLDKNGVRIGGGFGYAHKQYTLRLEEQYYNAGSVYSSYQTILGLRYTV